MLLMFCLNFAITSYKYLGIIVDKKLKFDSNVLNVYRNAIT